ncbi:hypothetical protein BN946_scf184905.g2 [Trametes cinnabarina]|uniref:Uncharacterized protein n=1 Tax=Pycnoporus cinnabarinus TaxID=5643 RepID=A0A060S742_PYCCI|nr:hypothetical protein BN946_scf184905.g2 [Trametes cinnabarina]
MAARGRTSDVPAWAREGAASPTPRTPSQRRGAVPAPASGSQPSAASRPKHRAEVVIVEPPKSTSSVRAKSIESEDEDFAMDDDSVHAHFATPPPVSRAPSPPSPVLRERSPVAPPVASSASRPAPAPRAGPSLDSPACRSTTRCTSRRLSALATSRSKVRLIRLKRNDGWSASSWFVLANCGTRTAKTFTSAVDASWLFRARSTRSRGRNGW